MNAFGECPIKGKRLTIESGAMAGETFDAEDWARNVMAEGVKWTQDIRNPAVLRFWGERPELCRRAQDDEVEYLRVVLTGIYGHVGPFGCIVMPDELGIEVG